jgi:hypothetical protein
MPQKPSQELKKSLEQARQQLAQSIQYRDYYNLEIIRYQNVVRALAVAVEDAENAERIAEETQHYVGIAQAIEAIINGSPSPVSALEVRDTLQFYGYDIGRYANPMAMIHQTLKRLVHDRRIREINRTGRFTRAEWFSQYYSAGAVPPTG